MPRMRPSPTHRPPRPTPRGREIDRALIAGCALALVFAAAFSIGSGWRTPTLRERLFARAIPPGDDALTTGTIVVVPRFGDDCQRKVIDNATWRVWDAGSAPCDEALAAARGRSGPLDPTRLDVIRKSFRNATGQ